MDIGGCTSKLPDDHIEKRNSDMRSIALYAYQHTSFYKNLYNKHNIDIETCTIPNDLPIVEPLDFIEYASEFKTDEPVFKVCMSSGTSLSPKILYRTSDDFAKSVDNQIQLMRFAGLDKNNIVGVIQPFGLWGYGELTLEACRQMNILCFPIGSIDDDITIHLLQTYKIDVVDITPSRLARLIKRMDTGHYIKIAMLAGEYLSDELIAFFQKKYKIKIFNQYGCTECDALGSSITGTDPRFLKMFDSFVYEQDKNNSLIITSLYHKGTPIIRYRLGDKVQFSDGYLLIGERDRAFMLYDGVKLQNYQITEILENNNWQCLIYRKKNKISIWLLIQEEIDDEKKRNSITRLKNFIDFKDIIGQSKFEVTIYNAKKGFLFLGNKHNLFIDMDRNDKDALVQLIIHDYFDIFYELLPFPLTKKKADNLYSYMIQELLPKTLIELGIFLVRKWVKSSRAIGDRLLGFCYKEQMLLLLPKIEEFCTSNDWVDREEGAKLLSVILSQCFDDVFPYLKKCLNNNILLKRAALLSTKYAVQETSNKNNHKALLEAISPLFFDTEKSIEKIYGSFVIGDGYMRTCHDLVLNEIRMWEKQSDVIHIGKIIRIFASSCGPRRISIMRQVIEPYLNSTDTCIQKAIAITVSYLKKHRNHEIDLLLEEWRHINPMINFE